MAITGSHRASPIRSNIHYPFLPHKILQEQLNKQLRHQGDLPLPPQAEEQVYQGFLMGVGARRAWQPRLPDHLWWYLAPLEPHGLGQESHPLMIASQPHPAVCSLDQVSGTAGMNSGETAQGGADAGHQESLPRLCCSPGAEQGGEDPTSGMVASYLIAKQLSALSPGHQHRIVDQGQPSREEMRI